MKKEIKPGDYIMDMETGKIALVINIDDDADFEVIDSDGDNADWYKDEVEFITKEEAESHFVIIREFTSEYHGVFDVKEKTLYVGCQQLSFDEIKKAFEVLSPFL